MFTSSLLCYCLLLSFLDVLDICSWCIVHFISLYIWLPLDGDRHVYNINNCTSVKIRVHFHMTLNNWRANHYLLEQCNFDSALWARALHGAFYSKEIFCLAPNMPLLMAAASCAKLAVDFEKTAVLKAILHEDCCYTRGFWILYPAYLIRGIKGMVEGRKEVFSFRKIMF